MTCGSRSAATFLTMVACVPLAVGCGHSEGNSSSATVTLGNSATSSEVPVSNQSVPVLVPVSAEAIVVEPTTTKPSGEAATATSHIAAVSVEARTFKIEGPENAIRVSFDDVDLLKVMNLDPVPADAPERLPKWLKELDGKRIRVRGFMYPPFQDTDIRGFVLARDNQICCFGRTPKEYDLVDIFLRKGVSTHYIQNRPFDVVGVFRIKSEIEKYTAMYELDDAIVIEK